MGRLKLTSPIIALLPSLVILPLVNQLKEDFHIDGISILRRFFSAAINPSMDQTVIQNAVNGMQITIATALISWVASLSIGICLGIVSSNIFWIGLNLNKSIGVFIRRLLAIPRGIHEVIWGLLLLQIMGLNPLVGILAITIPYSSLFARVIANQLDILDNDSLIAIKQTGAGSLSALTTSLAPKILPTIISYGGYRIECALRGATLLGVFGLGGIGTELQLTLQSLEFQELWTSLWILAAVMISFERAITIIRKPNFAVKNMQNTTLKNLYIISTFIVICIISLPSLTIDIAGINFHSIELPNLSEIKNSFFELPILELINTTLLLTITSAAIAIGTPPLSLLLLPGKLGSIILNIIWITFRLIPTPLIALLLLLCTTPSLSVAAVALGLSNMGVMGRLLTESIDNQSNSLFNAVKASGTTTSIAWLYGKLSPQSKSYLVFAGYRTDVLLRETAVVGVVGGIGLGWQLQESLSSFNWGQVIVITITFTALTLIGELISDKINEYWISKTTDTSLQT